MAIAILVFWLAWVGQSGYTHRARVSEGISLAAGAKAAIADYYATNNAFPANNTEAGLSDSISGRYVSDVSVIAGGTIQVTFGGAEPDGAIAGKRLSLRAIVGENGSGISWSCSAEQLPARFLPAACR